MTSDKKRYEKLDIIRGGGDVVGYICPLLVLDESGNRRTIISGQIFFLN